MGRSALPGDARDVARLPATTKRPRPRAFRATAATNAAPTLPRSRPVLESAVPTSTPGQPPANPTESTPRRRVPSGTARATCWATSATPSNPSSSPATVAVIGATEKEGSVGRTVLWNLISSPFGGTVYPVNPKRPNILGVKAYPTLAAVPEPVDLAVIVTPRHDASRRSIDECVAAGVQGRRSSSRPGFKEIGPGGRGARAPGPRARRGADGMRVDRAELPRRHEPDRRPQRHVRRRHRAARAASASSARAARSAPRSSTGASRENVGFSSVVSLGSMLDVGWGDLIDYLGDDPQHREHRHLHGDDRRRAGLPLGRARGRPHQADHRHQARPDRRRRPRRPPRTPAR